MASVPVDQLSPEQRDELACTYASLILRDDEIEITAENIQKLVKQAGISVEAYWPSLFSRLLTGKDVGALLCSGGGGGGGGGGAAAGGGGEAAAGGGGDAGKKEAEPEEEEEEMDFDLFG